MLWIRPRGALLRSATLELPLMALPDCFPGHQECLQTPGKNGGEHAYSFLGGLLATQSMISPMQMHILFLAGRWSVRGPTHMDGVRLLSHRIASFLDYSDEKVFSFKEENA